MFCVTEQKERLHIRHCDCLHIWRTEYHNFWEVRTKLVQVRIFYADREEAQTLFQASF